MSKILFVLLINLFLFSASFSQTESTNHKNKLFPASNELLASKSKATTEKTLNCIDTLRYPQLKEQIFGTSTFYFFELWASDVELMSQTYLLSGSSITINGVEVFARVKPLTGTALSLKASIYNVDASNNPTTLIGTGTGTISIAATDTIFKYRQINFSSPVTVSNKYAVVIEPTTNIVQLYVNNVIPTQSYDENLSRAKSNYYTPSGGNWVSIPVFTSNPADFPSGPYDFEALVAPKVSYPINTDFTISSNPGCTNTSISFTNTTSPSAVIGTRMYNYNIMRTFFQSINDSTYVWDIDGVSPLIWSTNASFNYSAAGTYDPTLYTLGGLWHSCLDMKTYTLPISSIPATPGLVSGNTTICAGSTQIYDVANVTNATSYTWTLPSGTTGSSSTNSISTTIGTTGGAVSVTANNSCGSSPASSINISVDVAVPATPGSISGPSAVCNATSQTYSTGTVTGASSYAWTIPSDWIGNSTSNSINITTGLQSGSLSVTASNSCGTSSPSTLAVTVATLDNANFSYSSNSFCKGGTNPSPTVFSPGNFSSTPTGLVFTNTSTGEIDLNSSTAGTYTVTYLTSGTCSSSSSQGITIVNAPDASFSYANNSYCTDATNPSPILGSGALAGIFSASPSGLSIIPVTGTINLNNSTPGTYTVTNYIAAYGSCPATSATFSITVNPLPTVSLNPFDVVCITDPSMILSGGLPTGGTYSGTGVFSGQFDPNIAGVGTFPITYSYMDANNCINSSTQDIIVVICENINNSLLQDELLITPNPARDNINISFRNNNLNSIQIIINTIDGKTIYSENILNTANHNIDLSRFDKGVYLVKLITINDIKTQKLIIQ